MIANFASMEIRPGSMGRPFPGIETAIVRLIDNNSVSVLPAGIQGELALRPGWPSMFRGYLHDAARYRKCFTRGFQLKRFKNTTGDIVSL